MVDELILTSRQGGYLAVRRKVAGDVWEVSFAAANAPETLLGTTDIAYFKIRLLAQLQRDPSQHATLSDAGSPSWVMTLASPHASLHAAAFPGGFTLSFVDIEGQGYDGNLVVDDADRAAWCSQVLAFEPVDDLLRHGMRRLRRRT